MQASEITYSFPLGPTYQDEDGNKVFIIALPHDTATGKFVGIVNGDLYPYEAAELQLYDPSNDKEIKLTVRELKQVLNDIDEFPTDKQELISKLIQELTKA